MKKLLVIVSMFFLSSCGILNSDPYIEQEIKVKGKVGDLRIQVETLIWTRQIEILWSSYDIVYPGQSIISVKNDAKLRAEIALSYYKKQMKELKKQTKELEKKIKDGKA